MQATHVDPEILDRPQDLTPIAATVPNRSMSTLETIAQQNPEPIRLNDTPSIFNSIDRR
jgi:hypothetical protein